MGTAKKPDNYTVTVWQNDDGGWSGHCINIEVFADGTSAQSVMKELAYEINRHRRSTRS